LGCTHWAQTVQFGKPAHVDDLFEVQGGFAALNGPGQQFALRVDCPGAITCI